MYKQIEALAVPAKGMIELSTMVFATLARNLIMYPVLRGLERVELNSS